MVKLERLQVLALALIIIGFQLTSLPTSITIILGMIASLIGLVLVIIGLGDDE